MCKAHLKTPRGGARLALEDILIADNTAIGLGIAPKGRRASAHQDTKKVRMNLDCDIKDPSGKALITVPSLFLAIETSLFLGKNEISHCCCIDSGASGNFVLNIEDLHDILPFLVPRTITRASASQVQSKGARTMKIKARNSRSEFIGQIPHGHLYFPPCTGSIDQGWILH